MQASIICHGCKNPIVDSYLLHIEGNEYWHEHCLQCCECCDKLIRVCYKKNGDIFCKYDYNRLFGTKCVACSNLISPNSVIMKVLDTNLFHIDCFKCEECGNKLEKGDEFVFKDKKLFCRADLNAMEQKSDVDVFSSSDETGSISTASPSSYEKNASGCKRPRTILTTQQRHNFKTAFELAPKPCRKVREKLSKETGLSVRVVQVWFQNQRAKLKKLHRKVDNGKKPEIHKTNVGKPSSKKTPSPKNFPLTPEDFNKISESKVTSSSPVSTFLPSREMKNINTRSIPPVHKPLQKTSIFMVSDHDTTLNQPTNTLDIAAAKYNTGHNNSSMGNNFGENGFHGSMNNNNNNDLVTRNNHVFAHASTNQFHSKHVHPPSASQFHLMPHLINAYL